SEYEWFLRPPALGSVRQQLAGGLTNCARATSKDAQRERCSTWNIRSVEHVSHRARVRRAVKPSRSPRGGDLSASSRRSPSRPGRADGGGRRSVHSGRGLPRGAADNSDRRGAPANPGALASIAIRLAPRGVRTTSSPGTEPEKKHNAGPEGNRRPRQILPR